MEFRSQPLREFSHYPSARRFLLAALAIVFSILLIKLAHLALFSHAELSSRAEQNLLARRRLSAPRGNIYDAQGTPIATNRRSFSVSFSPYGMKDAAARDILAAVVDAIGAPEADRIEPMLAARPRWTRHVLARRLSQQQVLPFLERPDDFPGLRVEPDYRREYPEGPAFAHLVGHVGRIQPADVSRYTRPRYLPDDEVGLAGLERALEDALAGHPGRERETRDARGRRLAEAAIEQTAAAGKDVVLTIDATLQRAAIEALAGYEGSVVIMDADTGALAALASLPTYDPLNPAAAKLPDGQPAGWFHRAARGLYPPGSTFKIVLALAALEHGIAPDRRFPCPGSFQPEGWPRAFWCGVRTGHGQVSLVPSLRWSCNCYYYELTRILSPEECFAVARRFGYAALTGSDIPGEAEGQLPPANRFDRGEFANFTIGQGSLLATPLQVARSFAALANGHHLPTPHVVATIGGAAPTLAEPVPLRLSSAHRDLILQGLREVVSEPGGTAHKAGFPPHWQVLGKTGTAENPRGGVDAWFAGIFPANGRTWAIVVHLEHAAAHGGEIAAPLAKELIGMMKDEG